MSPCLHPTFDPTSKPDDLPGVITLLLDDLHMSCCCHYKDIIIVFLYRHLNILLNGLTFDFEKKTCNLRFHLFILC